MLIVLEAGCLFLQAKKKDSSSIATMLSYAAFPNIECCQSRAGILPASASLSRFLSWGSGAEQRCQRQGDTGQSGGHCVFAAGRGGACGQVF